jgi:hypothetical protein
MENFAELMQRLLEIQGSGRQRSPKLIAEDERLMDRLQKRTLAGKRTETVMLSQRAHSGLDSSLEKLTVSGFAKSIRTPEKLERKNY